jgi:hypothetical protein
LKDTAALVGIQTVSRQNGLLSSKEAQHAEIDRSNSKCRRPHALRATGHGDDLVICDTNFPAEATARQTGWGGSSAPSAARRCDAGEQNNAVLATANVRFAPQAVIP